MPVPLSFQSSVPSNVTLTGIYLDRDASYSSSKTYSPPDANDEQNMFLVRVVVGEYCRGYSNMIAPPIRSGNEVYDSTVDDVQDPTMFVTFKDSQACPRYVIEFYDKN